MKKHVNIKITGKVQGVFFRASAKENADQFDIKGLVRNEPDGSVYIEAEGESENLNHFINWCRKGPVSARIDLCEVHEAAPAGYYNFTVQR